MAADPRWLAARRTGSPEPPLPPQSLLSNFPDPASIETQQAMYLQDLDSQVRQREALLEHRHAAAREYLRARCEQQKKHLRYTIEQKVQMEELSANARCSDLQHRLATEATRRRLQLEKQAHAMELEVRTRRMQEQLLAEDSAVHRRYFETTGPEAASGILAAHSSGHSHHLPPAAAEPSAVGLPTHSGALAQSLHVILHGVYGARVTPGAATDIHATAKVGQHKQRTGPARVVADPSCPIWERENHFVFVLGRQDFLLELEVDTRTGFHESSLGRACWDLRGTAPGQWHRLRERLLDGPGGEVEFDVCLLAAHGDPQHQDHPQGAAEWVPPAHGHQPPPPPCGGCGCGPPASQPQGHGPPDHHQHGHGPHGQMLDGQHSPPPQHHDGQPPHGGTLQVVIHCARNLLNKDTGIMGDYSDPFVECHVGKQKQKTSTINNNLNPVWSKDNQFTFQVGPQDTKLELQVFNHNMVVNQSLGKTAVDLHSLKPGEMRRLHNQLVNGGKGELEFSVCLAARQQPPEGSPHAQQHQHHHHHQHQPAGAGQHAPPLGSTGSLPAPPPGACPTGSFHAPHTPGGCPTQPGGCPTQPGGCPMSPPAGYAPPPTGYPQVPPTAPGGCPMVPPTACGGTPPPGYAPPPTAYGHPATGFVPPPTGCGQPPPGPQPGGPQGPPMGSMPSPMATSATMPDAATQPPPHMQPQHASSMPPAGTIIPQVPQGSMQQLPPGSMPPAGTMPHVPQGPPPHGSEGGPPGGASLHVIIHGGYDLVNRDSGLMGDVSDPYVVCTVGKTTHRTPTVKDDLNPFWDRGNRFVFSIGPGDQELRLEVKNENGQLRGAFQGDNSLGVASVGLHALRPLEWQRFRERLKNVAKGELEFDVCLELPHPGSSQHLMAHGGGHASHGHTGQPPASSASVPPPGWQGQLPSGSFGPAAHCAPAPSWGQQQPQQHFPGQGGSFALQGAGAAHGGGYPSAPPNFSAQGSPPPGGAYPPPTGPVYPT